MDEELTRLLEVIDRVIAGAQAMGSAWEFDAFNFDADPEELFEELRAAREAIRAKAS